MFAVVLGLVATALAWLAAYHLLSEATDSAYVLWPVLALVSVVAAGISTAAFGLADRGFLVLAALPLALTVVVTVRTAVRSRDG